jgi:hypothetical protein
MFLTNVQFLLQKVKQAGEAREGRGSGEEGGGKQKKAEEAGKSRRKLVF